MAPAPLRLLAVGDGFIPASYYSDAAAGHPEITVTEMALAGDRSAQHAAQQLMEVRGPAAVPVPDAVVAAVQDQQLLALHFAPVPAAVIDAAADLRLISVARAGLENVDIEAATRRGVGVVPANGRNAGAVAELQIALMLAETRNVARADASIKAGGWRKEFPGARVELADSTVGMVGFGHVGRVFAGRISGFGARLLAYDPFASAADLAATGVEPVGDLTALFARSDFVVVQARLSPDTTRFIGAEQFAAMKPTAYFVNVARSRLVDYDALYEALAAGRISGAGLDVFDDEPLGVDDRFRALDNVTATTHFGGDTEGTNIASARLVVDAAVEFATTGKVARAVNAAALGWQ